jgi:hypothetical protein
MMHTLAGVRETWKNLNDGTKLLVSPFSSLRYIYTVEQSIAFRSLEATAESARPGARDSP